MKAVIVGALAAILGTASSRPLDKRDYVTEVVYVTQFVDHAVVYVDQDGVPYSTSIIEQSSVVTSVDVVTTSEAVATVAPVISSSAPVVVAPSATPTPSSILPSFSLVSPSPEPSAVELGSKPSTTSEVQYVPPPSPAAPPPSPAAPPPAPASSSAAPAQSQAVKTEAGDVGDLAFGVTYDPFTGTEGNSRCKTDAEVADEFSRMSSYKVVRIYGMGCNIVPLAVQNAQKNGQTLMGGAYLSHKGNGEDLSAVITTWKDTIDEYASGSWDIMKLFSVSNERLNDHDMTASEIVDAIRRGRDQLRGAGYNGPVGAVDTVPATIDNPAICEASDVVMVNCHPFFDQNTAAADAGTFVKGQIELVKKACNTNRVVITETGWPHQGDANGKAIPSPENQAKALASIRSEFSSDVFIHNSFDSPWKSDWASSFNAERYWGVIQSAFIAHQQLGLQQLLNLLLRLDTIRQHTVLSRAKYGRQILVPPLLDIIIRVLPAMNQALNRVPLIADDEDNRVKLVAHHSADFLGGELQAAVASEEDSARNAFFLGRERGALACAGRVADAAPQDLRDGVDRGREARLPDAEVGGAGLGDDDVGGLQELAQARPEPGVCDCGLGRF
ncbi:hypothetical protein OPT61_g8457 [Boeremia exigua]|uniref:Uncharacterized protein n=1 Tax=Boeremia exigua TaxID=749465 RepID=A0ACC2HYQ2_9PLEO|nr:hypothetical protein OPT61_g8457 [Boeremia exigua]